MRALIIDDSRTMRTIERGILTQLGFTDIAEAPDGAAGLATADTFSPDLILVDGNMPHLDGLGFIRAFRARGHATPIILLTTETARSRVIAAIKAGVDDYIVKPFTPDVLSHRITETLARIQAA